ncbi:helix-turn-helix domain-containing protein [Rothia aerolata]|uniref:Transcriptional regulator n=1 Tax=Rothia aerolata TaxID=1812262 RepID=A0A917IPY3_9MICC|nr:helix-turn-helix transcriptional regulator [Rothia aerolata]GGH59080.1 transcriptional regulator [Rothia aerolata]
MPPVEDHRIVCHLDEILERRGMTLVELSHKVEITVANLSILKNNRAKAVRFATLTALCEALDCTPGELFTLDEEE